MPSSGCKRDDRQIRPHAIDAIDQMDVGLGGLPFEQHFFRVGGIVPLPRAEIGNQIENPPLALGVAQQFVERFERFDGPGVGLRDVALVEDLLQTIGEILSTTCSLSKSVCVGRPDLPDVRKPQAA